MTSKTPFSEVAVESDDEFANELESSERSALSNVFGSHVSLAELTGDLVTATASDSKRLPRRYSMGRTSRPREAVRACAEGQPARSLTSIAVRASALFFIGVFYGAVLNFDTLALIPSKTFSTQTTAVLFGLLAICVGVALPLLDFYRPEHMSKGKGGDDWSSVVRALGAVAGLTYAMSKLGGMWLFWVLADPCLWYIVDATGNGLFICSGGAIVAVFLTCLKVVDSSAALPPPSLIAGTLASLFATCVCFGTVGRRLLELPGSRV